MMRAEEELPDGSTCTVSLADGGCRSIISRVLPDGRCVWGQVFSRSDPEEHAVQVEDVVEHMRQDPEGFHRWWLP